MATGASVFDAANFDGREALGDVWAQKGKVDHDITRVAAGIANTALAPALGAEATQRILRDMWT